MKHRANIAAAIERNRIALLRMVFCWLSAATLVNVRSDRTLPRRLAGWVEELVYKAEQATGHLLIAVFYNDQFTKCPSPAFEDAAMHLIASNRCITLRALTITGVIKRLKGLRKTLTQLHDVKRRLAQSIAAHARVHAMKIAFCDTPHIVSKHKPYPVLISANTVPP